MDNTFIFKVHQGWMPELTERQLRESLTELNDLNCELIVRKKRKTRSLSQNGYYFHVVCNSFIQGAESQWGEHLSKEEAHENLKLHCNFKEIVGEGGEITKLVLSTKGLNAFEFEQYLDRTRKLIFNYFGIVVPMPGEQTEIEF